MNQEFLNHAMARLNNMTDHEFELSLIQHGIIRKVGNKRLLVSRNRREGRFCGYYYSYHWKRKGEHGNIRVGLTERMSLKDCGRLMRRVHE